MFSYLTLLSGICDVTPDKLYIVIPRVYVHAGGCILKYLLILYPETRIMQDQTVTTTALNDCSQLGLFLIEPLRFNTR